MRIVEVVPYSLDVPGGVATQAFGLSEWLISRGHTVTLIAPGKLPPPQLPPGGRVVTLGRATSWKFNGSVAQLKLLPGRSWRHLVAAADAVHVHEPLTPGLAYAAARQATRLMVTHHADFALNSVLAAALRLRSRQLKVRARIAVSPAAAAVAETVTGERPIIIGNAVAFPPLIADSRDSTRPRVAFIGRYDEPRKGFGIFAQLAQRIPTAEFVAIGPGRASHAGIEYLGQLPNAELRQELQRADIVVAPNLFGESFGVILIEALAASCAVVASDLPAFRDVTSGCEAATLCPVGDVAAFEQAVRARLQRPHRPEVARSCAANRSWDVVGPALEQQLIAVAEASRTVER